MNDIRQRTVCLQAHDGEVRETSFGLAKRPMCGCLNRLRPIMLEYGAEPGLLHGAGGAMVFIRRVDRSTMNGPIPAIVAASFCPMCGEPYA